MNSFRTSIIFVIITVLFAACGGGGGGGGPLLPPASSPSGEIVAGPLAEPSGVSSTANNATAKVAVFDFTLRETSDGDQHPLIVTDIAVAVSGTGNPSASNITWLLNGPDVNNAVGTYSSNDGKIHFTGLTISIPDDDTTGETYTVSVYFGTSSSLQDNQTFVLSINSDTDISVDSSGSRMSESNMIVDNGGGFAFQVSASKLDFTTQPPAAAVRNEDLLGNVTISFTDGNGYVDADVSDTITLTAYTDASCSSPAPGTLSSTDTGGLAKAAISGESVWTDLKYDGVGAIYLKAASSSLSACSGQVLFVQASSSGRLIGPSVLNGSVSSLATDSTGKVDVMSFILSESTDLDTKPLIVQSIRIVTNQYKDTDITWVLNGPDATNVAGVWSSVGGVKYVTFSGLNITISDDDTTGETYTISVYFAQQPQSLFDGTSISWQIDADVDVTTDPVNSSLMTGSHTLQSGHFTYSVEATQLSFITAPPAIAGTNVDLYGNIQVAGTDLNGNRDTNFYDTVTVAAYQDDTCSTAATGGLTSSDTGGLSHTTSSGMATWNDLKYAAWEHIYLKFSSGAYSICSPRIFMGLNGTSSSSGLSLSRLVLDANFLYLFVWDLHSSSIEKLDLLTGAPVSGFGSSGKQWVCDAADDISTMTEDADYLYVAGSNNGYVEKACKVAKTDGTEVLISSANFFPSEARYHSMVLDGTSLYTTGWRSVSGDYRWRMEKRDTSGNLVSAYGTSGVVESDLTADQCGGPGGEKGEVLTVDNQYIYLLGEDECGINMYWRVEKRDKTTGALATAFGTGGIVTTDPGTDLDFAKAIAQDATSLYIAGWRNDTKACHIEKRSKTDGSLVTAFGTNGIVETNNLRCDTISWVSEGRLLVLDGTDMYIGGIDSLSDKGRWVVEKRTTDTGVLVPGFGNGGILTADSGYLGFIDSLVISGNDLYITGGQQAGANYYYRLEKRDKTTGR